MVGYQIELESGGKITVPKRILGELGLKEGDKMTIELLPLNDGRVYLFIYPVKQKVLDGIFTRKEPSVK